MTVKAEPLSRNIERTLVYNTPPDAPDIVALHQVVTFKREPITDAKGTITGYTPWKTHQKQWPAVPVPQLIGYRSNLRMVPAMSVTPETKNTKLKITYTVKDTPKDVTPTKTSLDQAPAKLEPTSKAKKSTKTSNELSVTHESGLEESRKREKQIVRPNTAVQASLDTQCPQEKPRPHHHVYPVVTPIPLSQANSYLRRDTEVAHVLLTLVECGALQWRHDEYHTLFFAQN